MAHGLPSNPPEYLEFEESADEYCPKCGWDSDTAMQDVQQAHNAGTLLAIEAMDGSPFSAAGAAQVYEYYWYCPGTVTNQEPEHSPTFRCGHHFTTEVQDLSMGAMA